MDESYSGDVKACLSADLPFNSIMYIGRVSAQQVDC